MTWMNPQRSEQLRYAAALILKEMAKNAPAVFNVFVRPFIDVIWAGLRDQKHLVREAAKDALMVRSPCQTSHCVMSVRTTIPACDVSAALVLSALFRRYTSQWSSSVLHMPGMYNLSTAMVSPLQACLCLVEKRETRYRVQWYYRLFEETQRNLTRAPSVEAVHGSLLALGELLRHTGEAALHDFEDETAEKSAKPSDHGLAERSTDISHWAASSSLRVCGVVHWFGGGMRGICMSP